MGTGGGKGEAGTGRAIPIPESVTIVVAFVLASKKDNEPSRMPDAVGVNVTEIVQLWLPALPQVLVS